MTESLINYETVKYFSNEAHERSQFAVAIGDYQKVEYLLLASLCALNIVQSFIIFIGLAAGLTVCAKVPADCLLPIHRHTGSPTEGGVRVDPYP